jgi:uncharacterized protein YcbX
MISCAVVGSVAGIYRFPVKSMQGERVGEAELAGGGFPGDRAWALVDRRSGRPVSAKKVSEFPGLMEFAAEFLEAPGSAGEPPPVRITLPDGRAVRSDGGEADRALSDWFGRELALVPAPTAGGFLDAYPVSLITRSTLRRFEELAPGSRFDPRRFRMNLVIDTGAPGFVENGWLDRQLSIGDATQLAVTEFDSRCIMTTLAQGDLPEDPRIMRTMMEHNRLSAHGSRLQPCAGVYAEVIAPGVVRVGDPVVID